MSGLTAEPQRIRECSQALQRIFDEFTNRPNPADGYSLAELGSPRIANAFADFADN